MGVGRLAAARSPREGSIDQPVTAAAAAAGACARRVSRRGYTCCSGVTVYSLCSQMGAAWLACHLDGICLSRVAVLGPSRFQISDYPRPEMEALLAGPCCVISLVAS